MRSPRPVPGKWDVGKCAASRRGKPGRFCGTGVAASSGNVTRRTFTRWKRCGGGRLGRHAASCRPSSPTRARVGDLHAEMISSSTADVRGVGARRSFGGAPRLACAGRWSNVGFHLAHLIELHNQVEIGLYCGEGAPVVEAVDRRWPDLRRSLFLHVQGLRIQMRSLRARALVATAAALVTLLALVMTSELR